MSNMDSSNQTGRGRGRGRPYSGCGSSGRFHQGRSNITIVEERKKTLADYQYAINEEPRRTNSEYSEVTQFILNHIGSTFTRGDDIKKALTDRKEFDFDSIIPIKKKSIALDPNQKQSEDESYDAIWKAKILQHTKREDVY
jgi:hypothetical protein